MQKNILISHVNCMDGTASALVACNFVNFDVVLFLNYGEEAKFDKLELCKNTNVVFVDFSFKRDKLIEISNKVNSLLVLDHHKTAQKELENLNAQYNNIETVFNMEKAGIGVVCDYYNYKPKNELLNYIQDRDLWKFELPFSKEVNEYIAFYGAFNNIQKLQELYQDFNIEKAKDIGEVLLEKKEQDVERTSKKAKELSIVVDNVKYEIMALNNTSNISEVGNKICHDTNKISMSYFIVEDNKVICSLRSLENIENGDCSVIANAFGGGGHKFASGFTIKLEQLGILLNSRLKNE